MGSSTQPSFLSSPDTDHRLPTSDQARTPASVIPEPHTHTHTHEQGRFHVRFHPVESVVRLCGLKERCSCQCMLSKGPDTAGSVRTHLSLRLEYAFMMAMRTERMGREGRQVSRCSRHMKILIGVSLMLTLFVDLDLVHIRSRTGHS